MPGINWHPIRPWMTCIDPPNLAKVFGSLSRESRRPADPDSKQKEFLEQQSTSLIGKTPKDVIIFSLELFWIQELPSAAMRRFRQPFLGIDFPDILRNCSIAVFQYNRIMSEIVISFSSHICISCCLSSEHVLETCFEFLWVRRQGQDHCFGSIWGIRITGHHRAPASAWSQQRLSGSTSFTPVRQMCNVVDLPKARQDPMWDMAPNKASETKVRSVTWGLKHVYNWQISFFLDFLRLQSTTLHSN